MFDWFGPKRLAEHTKCVLAIRLNDGTYKGSLFRWVSWAIAALERNLDELLISKREIEAARFERNALQARLTQIAQMETPNCAHIGKKMAAVARGEER